MESYFIVYAIFAAAIAFLPASIAQRKGRSFGTWYIYGFLLWIVAIFHAISLPESGNNGTEKRIEYTKVSETEIEKKKFDINSPVHILSYDIYKGSDDHTYLSLRLQNLNSNTVKAIKLTVIGYNSFNEIVQIDNKDSFMILIQDLNLCRDTEFSNVKGIILPNNEIRKIKVSISQVCFEDGRIINITPRYIEVSPIPIDNSDERAIAKQYSIKAMCYPEKKEDYWICSCGYPNTGDICASCQKDKNWIFDTFSGENLSRLAEAQREKENQIKIEQEIKASKNTRIRNISLISLCIVTVLVIISYKINIDYIKPNRDYKQAVSELSNSNYDDAKEAFKVLGDYKDSTEMVKECNYQKALKLISNSEYKEAIKILRIMSDYKDVDSMLQSFIDEKTGYFTEQIGMVVNKNLSAELIYSPERATTEKVSATVTGYYIKGVIQEEVTCNFKGSIYSEVAGWRNKWYKYVGEFKNNTMSGRGTLYTESGYKVYSGYFENGAYNGDGKLYQISSVSNEVIFEGTWKNGNIE